MRITKSKSQNRPSNITLSSWETSRTNMNFNVNRLLALTGNKILPATKKTRRGKIQGDVFLTAPTINKRYEEKYLTDSWQILGINFMPNYKRANKWFHTEFSMSTDKREHTHLTKANYNTFD